MTRPSLRRAARVLERLTGESIGETTWAGLQRLVDDQVLETTQLDFKVVPHTPTQKDELRKDVTALANAAGGVLVFGIADDEGVATKLVGVTEGLEKLDGRLRATLRTRIEPPLDGIDVQAVASSSDATRGCLIVLVPASTRRPHAVLPENDRDALKFARRAGPNTEWLFESQVAALYRERLTRADTQDQRVERVMDDATNPLMRGDWLVLGVVPDDPGDFLVDRTAEDRLWRWRFGRPDVSLFPRVPPASVGRSWIGPRQVVLDTINARHETVGQQYSFHADGAAVVARQLAGPGEADAVFYFDHVVSHVLTALDLAARYTVEVAGSGGLAVCTATFHVMSYSPQGLRLVDPSWAESPGLLPLQPEHVAVAHTLDLDALASSTAELVAATGLVAGSIAQHFGEADARYITPTGAVRVHQFHGRDRDNHVIPYCRQHRLPTDDTIFN